jgi:hypothetical protein
MLDNGTPDTVFLNRDALKLSLGQFVARGSAASGQAIEVHAHRSPEVLIGQQAVPIAGTVRSGNFGFTASGLGADFLGFIGSKMLAQDAFVLDYAAGLLSVIRVERGHALAITPPASAETRVTVPFFLWPGEQPTVAGALGDLPLLIDFDTGDAGTLYLTPASRKRLEQQGRLTAKEELWRVEGLALGGHRFDPITVRLVEASGPQDFRTVGRADQLRLGAHFLSSNPCLWNFPAKTLTFLEPRAPFLLGLARAAQKAN